MLSYAGRLRAELTARNRIFARGHPHVESHGSNPVVVYVPEPGRHGNFYAPAYEAISGRPAWMRRFEKIHTQWRSLPKPHLDPARKWRELDSAMSSDALLMSVFCTTEVTQSAELRSMMGVDQEVWPEFGWKARVPLRNGRLDRTEVDMRWGDLLVEAKLTETDFQCREAKLIDAYRDLDKVLNRAMLPTAQLRTIRRRHAIEFAEEFSQEWEASGRDSEEIARAFHAEIEARAEAEQRWEPGYGSYQLIRNVLAAYSAGASFCVIHDERRPDLYEAWFEVMRAVKDAEMRVRCKVLTWQELTPYLPLALQEFLDVKYGIVAPGSRPRDIGNLVNLRGES